ncbi:MAG: hypothetical protein WCO04_10140, partial [Pseudomonadota bacterium]
LRNNEPRSAELCASLSALRQRATELSRHPETEVMCVHIRGGKNFIENIFNTLLVAHQAFSSPEVFYEEITPT